MNYVIDYLIVSAVISGFYGLYVLLAKMILTIGKNTSLLERCVNFLSTYWLKLFSLLMILILIVFSDFEKFLFIRKNYHIGLVAAMIIFSALSTSLFCIVRSDALFKINISKIAFVKSTMSNVIDGMLMEIPMRLLVQSLFYFLGANLIIRGDLTMATVLTGVIWVQFIFVQNSINKEKITKFVKTEIVASLWFSLWVGTIYYMTGNILFPILAHGLQRFVAEILLVKSFETSNTLEVNEG